MTDREWPEYPNQSGGETVTGPESAQEEAASERGWEADPPSPASEECQSEEGSNWERTAQEAEEEVPGGQRGEDLGTLGQAQELQEAAPFFQEEGSEPSQTTETSGWKPGMESSEDSREEPDLPAESPESSGQELQEAAALSPEETQVPFQTENAWEPGAERPENPDGGESQEPVAERPSAQPYDQSPAFSRPAPQAPPPVWNPGWQASYRQAPQNYPYGQGQYQGGWHPQQRQVPPPYYGGTPYQAPNPYQNQAPYGYPGQAARNQGQPGYQESRWYPQQPAQPARTGSVPPPSQPPQKEAGELPDAKPPEKKRMNKKTKAFLWVIGAVLVLLGAAMVLYSVGLTSGWFGGETAEHPGLMAEDEYDLAGFAVGVCDKKEMITGENLQPGDVLIGMASTGVHSNGFSLVRKVFEKEMTKEGLNTYYDELGKTLGETLLAPTRIYVKALKNVKNAGVTIKACSHITGGGFYENVPRMLKDGVRAVIHKDSYLIPPIFPMMQQKGEIDEKIMYNTFNMGIGMVVAVAEEDVRAAMAAMKAAGDTPYIIGSIEAGEKGVTLC